MNTQTTGVPAVTGDKLCAPLLLNKSVICDKCKTENISVDWLSTGLCCRSKTCELISKLELIHGSPVDGRMTPDFISAMEKEGLYHCYECGDGGWHFIKNISAQCVECKGRLCLPLHQLNESETCDKCSNAACASTIRTISGQF